MKDFVSAIVSMSRSNHENFDDIESVSGLPKKTLQSTDIAALVVALVWLLLVLCVGKWLWNEVGVKYIKILAPVSNVWEILGLSILAKLIIG